MHRSLTMTAFPMVPGAARAGWPLRSAPRRADDCVTRAQGTRRPVHARVRLRLAGRLSPFSRPCTRKMGSRGWQAADIQRRWRTTEEGREEGIRRGGTPNPVCSKSQGPGPIRVRRPAEDRSPARTHAHARIRTHASVHVRTPSLAPCLLSHFAFVRSFTFTSSLPQGSLATTRSYHLQGSSRCVVRMAHIPQVVFQKSLAHDRVG